MKNQLLEKARAVPRDVRFVEKFSLDEVELALAWVSGELTVSQVARALGKRGSSAYVWLCLVLRQHLRKQLEDKP